MSFPLIEKYLGLDIIKVFGTRDPDKEIDSYVSAEALERELGKGLVAEAVRLEQGGWYASDTGCARKTHQCLMIGIQPIEPELSAEDLLRGVVSTARAAGSFKEYLEAMDKAAKFLERNKPKDVRG